MLSKKIFLASSSDLKDDRTAFEIFISRKNKEWVDRGVFLKLIVWEDFLDAVSKTRLQDEYDKAVRDSDIFVMMFCAKVGKYTAEEFKTAFGQFKAANKPIIFTYFRDAQISVGGASEKEFKSLWSFQKKLKGLGHFVTKYTTIDGLQLHFSQQLDKLVESGVIELSSNGHTPTLSSAVASDLNISSVSTPQRLVPLDGHPILSPSGGPAPLYTGGFHVSFTLAHNGEGKHSINVHSMQLEVVRFTSGPRTEYEYRIEGAALSGAGMAKPHVFSIALFGDRVGHAQWVTDARNGTVAESRSANFFDTEDPQILTFSPGEANEEVRGTVLAQESGLYTLRFAFFYSVAGEDRRKGSEEIYVYADE